MTINPIAFAEEVNKQFLRYQLTAFPLSDPDLAQQAKQMLSGQREESQLVKGPYVSLSRAFAEGEALDVMVRQGRLHRVVAKIAEFKRMFAHQEAAYNTIKNNKHCLISTGTGSGKTEAFLYPILDHCFRLQDERADPGITAILVYPMNALAYDQLERLRHMLAGTGISFGIYVGSTPRDDSEIGEIVRMKEGEGKDKIPYYEREHEGHKNLTIAPFEERITEQEMAQSPPRILLTNINQLEFLMTRGKDLGMFEDAPLRFLVFDEAHTYTGARGAEVAILIRRVRAFCNRSSDEVICIGTSATLTDPGGDPDAGKKFAHRFFGIEPENIELVEEVYEKESWPSGRVKPDPIDNMASELYKQTLTVFEDESNPEAIYDIINKLSHQVIDRSVPWREGLYDALKSNEVVKIIYDTLSEPMHLTNTTKRVWEALGRKNPTQESEMELLTYLALGAVAEKDGTPILRPKLHYFIRGLGGAAAVLKEPTGGKSGLVLHFSSQLAGIRHPEVRPTGIFPILSCKNCGQHFLEGWYSDLNEQEGLSGGNSEGDNVYWPRRLDEEGAKLVFTNRFIIEMDEVESGPEYEDKLERKRENAFICKICGTIHHGTSSNCCNPECLARESLVPIYVLKEHNDIPNCPCCGFRGMKKGQKTISPLRPLTAITVADIHILAQDMINAQNAENKKLIVFADNRQDAAFQAAWMGDHARRYRLRHLMYRFIAESETPISIGDLERKLLDFLKADRELARMIAPEVFAGLVEEAYSSKVEDDMKKFMRISILREIVQGFQGRDSLENWGKLKIEYYGINEDDEVIKNISAKFNIGIPKLISGIESILDVYRRGRFVFDQKQPIFTQYWHPGCEEIQRGFLPFSKIPPKGLKLTRGADDKNSLVTGLTSIKGRTSTESFVKKWNVEPDNVHPLIHEIWKALISDWEILAPVSLMSSARNTVSGAAGVYQIDSAKFGLIANNMRYRCSVCNRKHTRDTPESMCTSINCHGKLQAEMPPEDDYNINLLKKDFSMLMAKEHTAQVPSKERTNIEIDFKNPAGGVNCLVATPTLELGVDIGALDMVLLRNVPPLPSNYWQRAGRAGRRHRMAVIYTYCRKSVHDEYFFEDPMKILSGKITPPRFNLRNPVMIEKHVHAIVLSELIRISQTNKLVGFDEEEQIKVLQNLRICFPLFITSYLFDEDMHYKKEPLDMSILKSTIDKHKVQILKQIIRVFSEHWPEDCITEVDRKYLEQYIDNTTTQLAELVNLFHYRLQWAIHTRNKLNDREREQTILDEMDNKLRRRCNQYIKDLAKRDLENYTLNALARSGFLPGYATNQGTTTATASSAFSKSWQRLTFELNRANTIAVREFVPGNLIYANGGKYKNTFYHLPFEKGTLNPDEYLINPDIKKVIKKDQEPDGFADENLIELKCISICDTELGFISHVSDEEENRYRLPVSIYGNLLNEHRGIDHYIVGEFEFRHHHGQKLRLLNAGPTDKVIQKEVGYPVCTVCGATRSPYASKEEIKNFKEHHEKICGYEPGNVGFSADAQVDGIVFKDMKSQKDAINLIEGIRLASNIQLEMDPDDLQTLIIAHDEENFDAIIYDPMPGGSGIIDQMIEQWKMIMESGISSLQNCTGNCETSCYDCLRTYRNMIHHKELDRHNAVQRLNNVKHDPKRLDQLPPSTGPQEEVLGQSTNTPEMRLAAILQKNNFPHFERQHEIPLKGSIKRTVPDFYYEDPIKDIKIAIYLDGLSTSIHGNEEQRRIDEYIRVNLDDMGYKVIPISVTTLDDPEILRLKLKKIARALKDKEILERVVV